MITWLTSLDVALFHLINGQGRNSFFDWLMPYITDLNHFNYYLLALGVWLLWKERKPGLVFLIFLGLTLAITDPFSSHLLKYWISRVRPCQILPDVFSNDPGLFINIFYVRGFNGIGEQSGTVSFLVDKVKTDNTMIIDSERRFWYIFHDGAHAKS